MTDTENLWVVAFIDPLCGGCKRLAVEWEKLVTVETVTVRKVKFGYVDISVEANKEILQSYTGGKTVELTPSVFMYGTDKTKPEEYLGEYKMHELELYIGKYCDHHGFGLSSAQLGVHAAGKQTADLKYDIQEGPAGLDKLKYFAGDALSGNYDIKGDFLQNFGGHGDAGYQGGYNGNSYAGHGAQ